MAQLHRVSIAFSVLLVMLGSSASGCSGGPSAADGGPSVDSGTTRLDAAQPPDGSRIDSGTGFDSGPPSSCPAPGALETLPCGNCGTVERFCTAAREWTYGACGGQHGCAPGMIDNVACGNCGTQAARCNASCAWETTGACTGEGVCEVGTRTRSSAGCAAGETRELLCTEACVYEPSSDCIFDGCPTPGVIESMSCGSCGQLERFCNASREWEYGTCVEAGECAPGSTRTAPCGRCGTRSERCVADCAWDTSGACTGEGSCWPGETIRVGEGCSPGETRLLSCDASCVYQPTGACEGVDAGVDAGRRDAGRDSGTCLPAGSPCTVNEDCCGLACFPGFGCIM